MSPKIFLIRHAEKPDETHAGVSPSGIPNEKDLTIRGWQRAGALVGFFTTAQFLFASHSSSNRPQQTLLPLSKKIGIAINMDYGKGDEERLAVHAKACDGIVLICWQHECMAAVANAIVGDASTVPQDWPKGRFDVVWVFELDPARGVYNFSQIPQLFLAGDSPQPI